MEVKQIDFSKTLSEDQVYNCILQNYEALGTDWITHQWNWINAIYTSFQDHLKFLIIISLVEKTLNFYHQVNITQTYDQFYAKDNLQINEFSISELCEILNLPKDFSYTILSKLRLQFLNNSISHKIINFINIHNIPRYYYLRNKNERNNQ